MLGLGERIVLLTRLQSCVELPDSEAQARLAALSQDLALHHFALKECRAEGGAPAALRAISARALAAGARLFSLLRPRIKAVDATEMDGLDTMLKVVDAAVMGLVRTGLGPCSHGRGAGEGMDWLDEGGGLAKVGAMAVLARDMVEGRWNLFARIVDRSSAATKATNAGKRAADNLKVGSAEDDLEDSDGHDYGVEAADGSTPGLPLSNVRPVKRPRLGVSVPAVEVSAVAGTADSTGGPATAEQCSRRTAECVVAEAELAVGLGLDELVRLDVVDALGVARVMTVPDWLHGDVGVVGARAELEVAVEQVGLPDNPSALPSAADNPHSLALCSFAPSHDSHPADFSSETRV